MRFTAALVAFALVAGGLFFLLRAFDPGRPRAVAPNAPSIAESPPPGSEVPEDAGAARYTAEREEPAPEAPANDAVARLEGSVTLVEDGSPVADVDVELYWEGHRFGRQEPDRVRTGPDGRFAHELDESRSLIRARVRAGPETTRESRSVRQRVELGRVTELELRVSRGATLRGVVVDVDGQRVAGAEVSGWCRKGGSVREDDPPDRTTVSEGDGSFELSALGSDVCVQARAETLVPYAEISGELEPGRIAEGLEVVVGPGQPLEGRVVDESGRPQPDLTVQIGTYGRSSGQSTHEPGLETNRPRGVDVVTDDAGRFTSPARALVPWGVNVQADGYRQWNQRHDPSAGPLEIVLDRGVIVRGRVVGPGGPLAGAEVFVRGAGSADTETGADGSFELTGLEDPEHGTLHVHAAGHALHVRKLVGDFDWSDRDSATGWVEPFGPKPDVDDLWIDVSLDPGRVLAGRVVDVDGTPVSKSRVWIEGERFYPRGYETSAPPTWEWSFGLNDTTTDEAGRFRFDDLYDGRFELRASDPADPDLDVTLDARSGREDVEVVFDRAEARGVVLMGRVIDALTGDPVEQFTLSPFVPNPGGRGAMATSHERRSDDGSFRLAGLEPGVIELKVSAPEYATWSAGRREYEVGEHAFDVALAPARHVEVRIVDPAGEPWTTSLTAEDATGEPLFLNSNGMSSTQLRVDGVAYIEALPAAPITLFVEHAGGERAYPIDLTRPLQGPYEIVLERVEPIEVAVEVLLVSVPETSERPLLQDLADLQGPDALFEALGRKPGELGELFDASTFEVELRDADAEVVSTATGRQHDGGKWRLESTGSAGGSAAPSAPVAHGRLRAEYPTFPLRLIVEADGHETIDIELGLTADDPHAAWLVSMRRAGE